MYVSYSVNGGADQELYSGTGGSGSGTNGGFKNVIGERVELEVFKSGADDPVPTIEIKEWSLKKGACKNGDAISP